QQSAPTSQGTPAPPLQGIPIPVQMPGAPAPTNNPVTPNPPPPTPAPQAPGGFAPEPVLDDSIPIDWY
ncbi:energy transducer TonB, partial [Synechocystis salina LEGE 06099]|nr:energy transducer TonB [Synechocystis salina LEGE 06099]